MATPAPQPLLHCPSLLAAQVANQHSDSVAVFRRDAATGLLTLASVCSTAGAVAQPTFAAVVPA